MIKDYNADINRWIISQSNPQEKSAVELSVVRGNRDRSRAWLNPKSARWLISIKPNYYLRLGSVWHVIRKQLFFILSFSLVFFIPWFAFLRLWPRQHSSALGGRTKLNYRTWFVTQTRERVMGSTRTKSFCDIKAVVVQHKLNII